MNNPWVERFTKLSDQEIRARAAIQPRVIKGLKHRSPTEAQAILRHTLGQVHYASEQEIAILRRLIDEAAFSCRQRYPDRQEFFRCFDTHQFEDSTIAPVCLTGYSGIGKTALVHALARVLPGPSTVEVDEDYTPFPLQSAWHVQLSARQSLGEVTDVLAKQAGLASPARGLDDRKRQLRRLAYRNGVGVLLVDEMQFASQSSTANAQITRLLLGLKSIGVPLVYVANFSLLHRLKNRNHEDRNRLLLDPIVLRRRDAGSSDWTGLIRACVATAPTAFALDPDADGHELWRLTAGLPGALAALLSLAYGYVRQSGRYQVNCADLRQAFKLPGYQVQREDIEQINRQMWTGKADPKRLDLWCPFDDSDGSELKEAREYLDEEKREETARRIQYQSLNTTERKAYDKRQPRKHRARGDGDNASRNAHRAVRQDRDLLEHGFQVFRNQRR